MSVDQCNVACQDEQKEVVDFLTRRSAHGGSGPAERFETHGNLIFAAGSEAWKIKRAVRFPYMDFSTLAKREVACRREVEINRRLALPIARSPDGGLAFDGSGEVVEWAVHMRRFEQAALLSNIAAERGIEPGLAKAIADAAYRSHQQADRASPAAAGAALTGKLIASLCTSLTALGAFDSKDIAAFSEAAGKQFRSAETVLEVRARQGLVRRCHGDLHLANIVLWQGRPVFYDAIEFDEAIATIDTLYDLAFLLMDLDRLGLRHAANIVLNRYLRRSGQHLDLEGLAALPLFLALRAGIRAMVTAERAAQECRQAADRDRDTARDYLRAALAYASPLPPQLIAVGGLSGTGKSTLAAALAPRLGPAPGAVHLRSDLERKALFGVDETVRLSDDAYSKNASERVYGTLVRKARLVLAAGHSVVVDAVYAAPRERQAIEAVAAELAVSFRGLWLHADAGKLAARVAARRHDASDATVQVVRTQLGWDIGALSPAWTGIDAGASRNETLTRACAAAGIGMAQAEGRRP
jgi:aminoglycoside phosphotransferase family enzyme/predicted kinase